MAVDSPECLRTEGDKRPASPRKRHNPTSAEVPPGHDEHDENTDIGGICEISEQFQAVLLIKPEHGLSGSIFTQPKFESRCILIFNLSCLFVNDNVLPPLPVPPGSPSRSSPQFHHSL